MVAAGEKSGHLDTVLERLAEYVENRQKMRSKLLQAMIYCRVSGVCGGDCLVLVGDCGTQNHRADHSNGARAATVDAIFCWRLVSSSKSGG